MNKQYSEGKKNYLFHLFIIVTFLIFFVQVSAQTTSNNWYVDKQSSGGNTGLSWSNAWISFANINWSLIQPGDTVFISGGTDSLVYNETISIGKSGTIGNNIIVRNGLGIGHSGKVIIDGGGSRSSNVDFNSFQYVTLYGISLEDATSRNIILRTSNCIISHCDFYISSGATCGIDIRGTKNIIEYCNSNTGNSGSDGQTDFIQQIGGGGTIARYNYVRNRNTNVTEHSDCFQFYAATACTLYNNKMWQDNSKTYNAQGIYIEECSGTWIVYNNTAYAPNNTSNAMITFRNYTTGTAVGVVYSNSIYSGGYCLYMEGGTSNTLVKNNIFYSTSGNAIRNSLSNLTTSYPPAGNIDYNIYYRPSSTIVGYTTSNKTWSDWRALGYDAHGYNVNPLYTNPSSQDFALQTGSPAIDVGTDISSPYNIDVLGVSRPQGNGWDIGAFEFTGAIVDVTPPKLLSASLVDDITLELSFSENIELNSVINPLNYNISQGIVVNTVSQITSNLVRLNTTQHQPNIEYSVVVNNLYDLSGNQIDLNFNSKVYSNNIAVEVVTQLPITDASASHWYADYVPEKSIDGVGGLADPTSRWGGAVIMPDTIYYDLGSQLSVSKTRVSFYRWEAGRKYKYSINVSNDFINWQTVVIATWSDTIEWNIKEFSPITARYISLISLENNETNYAVVYEFEAWGNSQSTDSDAGTVLPNDFELSQNYPNPFNPSTNIVVKISKKTNLRLSVYDIIGNLIEEITNTQYVPGVYEFNFNANGIASGIYFYRVEAEGFVDTKKMVLLK